MNRALAVLALLPLFAAGAWSAPFDMSGERSTKDKSSPSPEKPLVSEKSGQVMPLEQGNRRYLLPFQAMTLSGETASKTWVVYLTPGQAAAAKRLNYGYKNAIVVAPETSRLSVLINDRLVSEQPVQSPNGVSVKSIDVPKSLLRPGANKISFRVRQQHRTDCSVQSTYELWSQIEPEKTFIELDSLTSQPSSIDDVRAIGVDKQGRTRFRIIASREQQRGQVEAIMRLSQGLSLLARMPNQSFLVTTTLGKSVSPGELAVAVGTASELSPLLPQLPDAAKDGTFTGFVHDERTGQPVLVLSGPTWQSVDAAIESLVMPLDRPDGVLRDVLSTQTWTGMETPFFRSQTSISFAKLGVTTTEFAGRRFRTEFDIGVPADFYANAYGEAQILLDAAYSDQVMPGSHIDIYVNGSIATTVPITSESGGIFRHLPIRLTMRHFRPGANRIEIESIINARSDLKCVPDLSSEREPRFALFDTSEFILPNFARIAQLPNLSAVGGTGFPYSLAQHNLALLIDRPDDQTLSTAATFLGKLALAAGRPLKVDAETSFSRIGENNAIFVGAISQIPLAALEQTQIAEASRTAWGNPAADLSGISNGEAAFDQWRSRVRGGSWEGQISALEDWLTKTFDLSLGALRLLPSSATDILPSNNATFLIAQGLSPSGDGNWMVLSAPSASDLQFGMAFVSDQTNWQALQGHMVLFDKVKKELVAYAATQSRLVKTQPFSFANYRLIAANWLSSNILSYAALLACLSIGLGVATSALLKAFGRKS